ncbi:MAG: hypothetical protein ABIR00_05660 [Nitrosospira sp.]
MKNRNAVVVFILSILFTVFISPGSASAGSACHDILTNGFYSEYARIDVRLRDRSLYAELCSSNFAQALTAIKRARRSGDDGSLGLSYGLFTLDDGGTSTGANSGAGSSGLVLNEERFMQWKSGYCSKNSAVDSSQAAEFFMQKAAAGHPVALKAVEAWSTCMQKREGLTCWASPNLLHNEEFLLNVKWTKTGSAQPQAQPEVRHSFLTRGAVSKFEGAEARRILPVGYKLNAGTSQISVTRPVDKAIFANLTINHEDVEHSCSAFIPSDSDFTLSAPFVNRLKFRYPG